VNSWKVILATMVIFGAGVVTGGLLVRYSDGIHAPRAPRGAAVNRPGQPFSAGGMRLDFLRRAGRELNLTPEQRERLDQIIKESQERTRKVTAPFLREELQRTRAQFRELLTPEQRPRFDELLKQQQHQRAREPRHPPGPADRPADGLPPPPKP